MCNIIKKNHFELGIVFANIGTQLSVITKEFFPNISFNLTYAMFFLSLLLLFNYKVFLNYSISMPSPTMVAVLIYNIYALINGLITGASMFSGNDALIYTIYVILMWICLMTNFKKINTSFLINTMWGITGIYSCLLFYVLTDHLKNFSKTGFTFLPSGADRITLSVIGFMHLCVVFLFEPQKVHTKILKYIFSIIAFYDLMFCSRRGLLVALILIILYQFYLKFKEKITNHRMVTLIINTIVILLMIIIASRIIPDLSARLIRYFNLLVLGLNTYLGNFSGGVDAAAVFRNNVINSVPQEYLNSDFITILFGNGYGYKQLDLPYLQAFTDLGLLGGIYYLFIQGFYPVKAIIKRSNNKAVILIKHIGIMTVTYNLYSGVPYNHYKFVGLIFLIYAVNQEKKSKISEAISSL